ncbi:hypothetical protein UlMin_003742 [Ulmus minor]
MDREIESFIKVWIIAITSLCYCYYIASRFPKGVLRFISLLPIFYLFIILPLDLHSFHLGAPTTFFLVWLGTFKLLLFSFDHGPLSSSSSSQTNLFHFISIACLPIKIKQNPPQITTKTKNPSHQNPHPKSQISSKVPKSVLLTLKISTLALLITIYQYRPYLHHYTKLALYCLHMYLGIELVLALTAIPARTLLGLEIEPQFDEPYLSTSLQDFWGRRWNLMVTSILRPTTYDPIRRLSTHLIGSKFASLPAILAVFVVSGLMHEAIYYYLSRAKPTWEVTCFFVLQGVCTAAEVAAKKVAGEKWRVNGAVSGGLALGFLVVSGNWLFFPQLLRNGVDQKAIKEYAIVGDFLKAKFAFPNRNI